jgi:hypothetical protein
MISMRPDEEVRLQMAVRRKLVITAATTLALGASGVGLAQAVSGEDEQAAAGNAAPGAADRATPAPGQDAQQNNGPGEQAEGPDGGARADGDDADERVSGPDAERAERAAIDAAGGGRAVGVERENEGASAWEVEVVRSDGGQVKVELTGDLETVAVQADDDSAEDGRETGDDDRAENDNDAENERRPAR